MGRRLCNYTVETVLRKPRPNYVPAAAVAHVGGKRCQGIGRKARRWFNKSDVKATAPTVEGHWKLLTSAGESGILV